MCRFETTWGNPSASFAELPEVLMSLKEMEKDGLLEFGKNNLTVTEKGRPFVRNICMAFDLRLKRKAPGTKLFSMTFKQIEKASGITEAFSLLQTKL